MNVCMDNYCFLMDNCFYESELFMHDTLLQHHSTGQTDRNDSNQFDERLAVNLFYACFSVSVKRWILYTSNFVTYDLKC